MDPDVVEIPRFFKHKQIDMGRVIDLEDDSDSVSMMTFDNKNKGKAIKVFSDEYDDRLVEGNGANRFGTSGEQGSASANGVESSKVFFPGTPNNIINLDDHSSDDSCDYVNDYTDLFLDADMDVDTYALLQAHFDNSDIPAGVEAPVPFLLDPHQSNMNPLIGTNFGHTNNVESVSLPSTFTPGNGSNVQTRLGNTKKHHRTIPSSSSAPRFPKPVCLPTPALGMNSSLPNEMDYNNNIAGQSTALDMPTPLWSSKPALSKRKVILQHKDALSNSALGALSKSRWRRPFQGRKKQSNSSSPSSFDSINQPNGLKSPPSFDQSFWAPDIPEYSDNAHLHMKYQGLHNQDHHIGASSDPFGVAKHLSGGGPSLPWSQTPMQANALNASSFGFHTNHGPWGPPFFASGSLDNQWVGNLNHTPKNDFAEPCPDNDVPAPSTVVDTAQVMDQFQIFKQFDTVDDYSDHYYKSKGSSTKQPSRSWAKRIQDEWKILEKDLPDNIFVRVYESRMDLLRAVIVGAEGTPYHDGLFFFDVFFPSHYPSVPPLVYYHSGGLRLNPNRYNCGKVCLSLLNTWSGSKEEKWLPGTSTMLQVLVSIQALILNAKPYFNEPGYAPTAGSAHGEKKSEEYNENTFLLSLKTMTYSMRKPPKHFENFAMGHFVRRGKEILVACKAYMEGAQVGCLVRGGVQDVDEGDKSSSKYFKDMLVGHVQVLVKDFTRIGLNHCDQFLPPPNPPPSGTATSGNSRNALRLLSISG